KPHWACATASDSPIPMPSEPSDGIFDAPAVYRRGAGLEIPEPSFPTIPQSRNSSFPRRRESGPPTRRESIGND
ncbi:hypothetical protein ABWF71_08525, partial [Neisseria gonorrhoeae]|uniref:hypothetical protein n=1 Tax=Neisseria gonorrhoeae TaxID=485 RepID=UPI0034E9451E